MPPSDPLQSILPKKKTGGMAKGGMAKADGMSKIVNLKTLRKQRARDDKRRRGDAQAAQHGLSKAEKDLSQARAEKARRDLDGHKKD